MPASAATPSGSTSSTSRISWPMSASRRFAPSWRSSARGQLLARGAHRFERRAGGAIGLGQRGLAARARRRPPCGRFRPARSRRSARARCCGECCRRVVEARALVRSSRRARLRASRSGCARRLGARVQSATSGVIAARRPPRAARPRAQRLRLGAHFGKAGRAPRASFAHARRALRSSRRRRRQARRARHRLVARRFGLGSRADASAGLRLVQRGAARGDAVELALALGMALARRIGFALRSRRAVARLRLAVAAAAISAVGSCAPPRAGVSASARALSSFALDVGEAIALGEPARGAGRRIGRDREAVPAPQIAFAARPAAGRA